MVAEPIAMPAVLTPPRTHSFPRTKTWTVDEFHNVRETGVWDGLRTFLVHGTIWEQGPMNPPHANSVDLISEMLRAAFGISYRVRCQLPLVLGFDTDPMPDVAVVRGGLRDFATVHPTSAELVVEVADTTLFQDTTTKAELYAEAGIREYWVVDVDQSKLLVFRDPSPIAIGGFHYRSQQTLTKSDSVSPLALPSHSLPVAELLL
jgi:Uma2 family endonuclease